MKIRCNFTLELTTKDHFQNVIQYMQDIGVYDDFIKKHNGLKKSALRAFIKSEAEDFIKFRIGI